MHSGNQRKFIIGVWVVVVIVCVGLTVYGISMYLDQENDQEGEQTLSLQEVLNYEGFIDEVPEDLQGQIYITLELGQELRPYTFALDLATQRLVEEKHPARWQYVSMYGTPINDATSSEKVLFYAAPYAPNQERPHPFIEPVSTYVIDKEGEASLIASTTYNLKRAPDWSSERGLYTFSAYPNSATFAEAARAITAEGWDIYVGDLDGNERMVAENGINPKWGPDGNIYYLGVDGVYRYNFDVQTTEHLWEMDEGVMYGRRMDISPDGTKLALTNMLVGGIQMMAIKDLETFTLEEQFTFTDDDRRFFDPSFSPDGDYLVYVDMRRPDIGEPIEYSYLEIMRISDQTTYRLIDAYRQYLSVAPKWIVW